MSEDRLLHDLGHLAREEQEAEKARLDERWDRLSAGTLTPEEEAELLALAETSPEAREAYEAFRPLGAEFQARVVESLATQPREKPKARVLPFRRSVQIGGWVTAAAAAVLVVLLWPPTPLPEYQLAVSGGSSETREERPEEAVPDFAPGDRIRVVLRPPTASEIDRLEARCFLFRGKELSLLEMKSQFDPRGAVKMEGSLDRDLQPGIWTLWAVVGRPGDLPDPAELRAFAARPPGKRRDWTAMSQEIRVRDRGR